MIPPARCLLAASIFKMSAITIHHTIEHDLHYKVWQFLCETNYSFILLTNMGLILFTNILQDAAQRAREQEVIFVSTCPRINAH